MIIAAAIRLPGGLVLSMPPPERHVNIKMHARTVALSGREQTEGFLDHKGRFLTRHEAMQHVLLVGQQVRQHPNVQLGLFTEDLW